MVVNKSRYPYRKETIADNSFGELSLTHKHFLAGSQTIPSVVGSPHDMYPGMHPSGDPSMGHVASGMTLDLLQSNMFSSG